MIFAKLIDDPTQYIPRQDVLDKLLAGDDLEKVFYSEIIADLTKSTKPLRRFQMLLLIIAVGCSLLLLIELLEKRALSTGAFVTLSAAGFSAAVYSILNLSRSELSPKIIIEKSKDEAKATNILKYFGSIRSSGFPLAKPTSRGLQNVGKLHVADGGLLALVGNPKQRIGIRKFNLGWGELYFPKPELFEEVKAAKPAERTTNIQQKIMNIKPQNDAIILVKLMKSFAKQDDNTSHVAWFEYLQSTINYRDIMDGTTRHEKVIEDLNKRKILIHSRETCRRIAQTKNYPELEKHLRCYLTKAQEAGNSNAKSLLLEFPEDN